jgi:hypothetical protein
MRHVHKILVGNSEGKRKRRRLSYTWEDNIKMDIREIVSGVVDAIYLAEDSNCSQDVLNMVVNRKFFD